MDARTAGELEENGVIEAANFTHIPLESFIANMADWPADMDTTITVYC